LWDVCTDQEAVDIVIQRTLLAKKYERQKERDSAITKSVSAQSRASRRQQRSNVASINDIFGAPNANPAKAEAISNNEEFEVEESSNEIEKDKIPEKITEKMKSKAVSDLPNAARDLVDLALQRRTLDNVSVLVVWF
jgi:serine/threonine protein phosphatase PrpC